MSNCFLLWPNPPTTQLTTRRGSSSCVTISTSACPGAGACSWQWFVHWTSSPPGWKLWKMWHSSGIFHDFPWQWWKIYEPKGSQITKLSEHVKIFKTSLPIQLANAAQRPQLKGAKHRGSGPRNGNTTAASAPRVATSRSSPAKIP